jgi:hypothetical protein
MPVISYKNVMTGKNLYIGVNKMQRLDILLAGNVISQETHLLSNKVISMLCDKYNFTEQDLEMFITHLAMAHQRIKSNSPEKPVLDDDSIAEMQSHKHYEQSKTVFAQVEELIDLKYPENEAQFMIAHIINLLDK